jgi:cell division septation protein DedD
VNRPFDDEDAPPGRGYTRDPGRSDPGRGADREISLGAPAILGIFFALALLCAGFFGFGYSLGRKSAQAVPADSEATVSESSSSSTSAKPAAGSLASQPAAPAAQPAADDSATRAVVQTEPAPSAPSTSPSTSKNAATPADGMIVGDKLPTSNQQPAISPTGTIMVQIAAVSSQDVADILLASLKKKGYSVAVRHDPQDKLLHVQIGPFADRKDAEAMQQRVLADGFNAIVK